MNRSIGAGSRRAGHVHALLGRGGQIIDELFPGFLRDLDPSTRLLNPAFIFALSTAKLRRRRRGELLPVAGQKVA
ncbi:hypothetical protein [Mycolicibacterium sp. P1-5]|uniref:hypothetical protein n=1 Tax=Mycolicibacterium sp. P1-5 TaxID=2024617 RepID=UPI0018832B86|nr:hypothetical protein [Mycolicibacterium sp. P1-5]